MVIIILENSNSRILNLTQKDFYSLRQAVAFFDMSIFIRRKNRQAATKLLIDELGRFPTGLLKRVETFLMERNLPYQIADNRIKPNKINIGLVNKLDEPTAYLEQELGSSAIAKNDSGILEMPTGIGKTRTIKEALLKTQRPTLIITPSSNLKTQTYNYISACFGNSSVSLMDKRATKPIVVTNYHAIENMPPEYFDQFQQVIFDEFHNAAANTCRSFFQTHFKNIYYRYGLTATNFKNDDNEAIYLECVLSDTIYVVPVQDAINKGYITPVVPMFFNIKNYDKTSHGVYRSDVKHFIDNNADRNAIAIETAQKMMRNNIPTLILVDHVEHGREIQRLIGDSLFLNGQDESAQYNMDMIKEFNEFKRPCLIGTSVLGEGVDTKVAGACIDLSGGKARSQIMQKVGRVVRKSPNKKVGYYFNFMDYGAKHLISHSRTRLKIIEETYGQKVQLIDT